MKAPGEASIFDQLPCATAAAFDAATDSGISQSHRPMVTFYVNVPDMAAALKTAESLGGKTVLAPTTMRGGPEIAQISDPEGTVTGRSKVEGGGRRLEQGGVDSSPVPHGHGSEAVL